MRKVLLVIGGKDAINYQREIKSKLERKRDYLVSKIVDLQKAKSMITADDFTEKAKKTDSIIILCTTDLKDAVQAHAFITYNEKRVEVQLAVEALYKCMEDTDLKAKLILVYFSSTDDIPKCLQGIDNRVKFTDEIAESLMVIIR